MTHHAPHTTTHSVGEARTTHTLCFTRKTKRKTQKSRPHTHQYARANTATSFAAPPVNQHTPSPPGCSNG